MVHTLPDYTTKYKMTTVFGQIDTGELAARLKSIDTFDRRGNVLWMDDFEGSTLLWDTVTEGANAEAALNTVYPKSGSQCLVLTAGEGGNGIAGVSRFLGYPVLSKMGLEISFMMNANITYLYSELGYDTATTAHRGIIRYLPADDKFQYSDSEGHWRDLITSIALEDNHKTYHTMKLVINAATNYYTRFIINNTTIDMSSYALAPYDTLGAQYMLAYLFNWSEHASAQSIYIDNIILTQNEP